MYRGLQAPARALLLMVAVSAAQAQEPASGSAASPTQAPLPEPPVIAVPDAPASANAGVAVQELPAVIVTAQKFKQTLEVVPASVSTVDGDFIRKSGASAFDSMQDYTPNVTISLSGTSGTFAIRGFATPDTNPGFDPSVGAVVDGVYYGRSQFMSAFFSDLDRFEVLRGPQGSLFGKNSTAGILQVVTQAPGPEATAVAEVQSASYGDVSIRPVIQLPLGSTVSLRFSGNYSHGDKGPLYNTFLKRKEEDIVTDSNRLRGRWTPDALWTLDLEGFYSRSHSNNNGFQFSTATPDMLALARSYDPQVDAVVDHNNSASFESNAAATIQGGNMIIARDVSALTDILDARVTLTTAHAEAITTARDLDADFTPVNFIHDTLAVPSLYKQTSEELRMSGHGESMEGIGYGYNFVGGFFISTAHFRSSDIFAVEDLGGAFAYCNATPDFCGLRVPQIVPPGVGGQAGQALGRTLDQVAALAGQGDQSATVKLNQQGSDYAVFGQFEHFFLPHWALIGGLRWGVEKKTALASSHSTSQLVKQIANQTDHDTPLSRIEHDLSPKGGIKWEGSNNESAYLTWARGYKSGGFNALPLSPSHLQYEPEQATSIEAGGKALTHFLGGPLRLSVSIFRTDFDDLQVSTFLGGDFIVLNAAAARSQGFDLDLHWLTPVQGISLTAAAGLADARYKSYPCAPALADSTTPGNAACNPSNPGDTTTQDLGGKRLSFSPRWTASLIPAYQFNPFDAVSTTLALDVLYRGNRYLDVDLDPRKVQAATTVINTRVSLESPGRQWGVSLVAHNLTDKVFGDQAISQPLAPGNILLYRTDRGRYVTGNLTMQF